MEQCQLTGVLSIHNCLLLQHILQLFNFIVCTAPLFSFENAALSSLNICIVSHSSCSSRFSPARSREHFSKQCPFLYPGSSAAFLVASVWLFIYLGTGGEDIRNLRQEATIKLLRSPANSRLVVKTVLRSISSICMLICARSLHLFAEQSHVSWLHGGVYRRQSVNKTLILQFVKTNLFLLNLLHQSECS